MSKSASITKEDMVRAVLELLSKSSKSPGSVGELVLFLEREVEGWIEGNSIDLIPLWHYCRDNSGWDESLFRELIASLQQRFADRDVHWISPFDTPDAADLAGDFASFDDGSAHFRDSEEGDLVEWIIDGIRRSPVERIIDPEKLRGFLSEALEEMKEGNSLNLQLLWEVLLDADGVDEQMLIKAFLVMQVEKRNHGVDLDVEWPNLVANLPEKMRTTLLKSMGLKEAEEPEKPVDPIDAYADAYAIKSNRELEASGAKKTTGTGARVSTASRQARARQARIPSGPMSAPDSQGFPKWLLWAVVIVIFASIFMYYFVLYTPTPGWDGQAIDGTPYKKILSFEAIRMRKGTVNVKVTEKFMAQREARRAEKAYDLWIAIRRHHQIYRLVLFSPNGKVVHKFETR